MSHILLHCLPEPPLAEMALRRGPPAVSYHLAGANCCAGNPPPRGNLGLKINQTDAILKKFYHKMNFELKMSSRIIQLDHLMPSSILCVYPFKQTCPLGEANF
jgi:hypothetical protein